MNEPALRNHIKALGDCLRSLHHWSDLWTALVVIGVVLEVVVLIKEHWDDLRDFRRGFIHAPERPSVGLLAFGVFGVALVAGGIMGELLVGIEIQHAEEDLAQTNEDLVNIVESTALSKASQLSIALNKSITEGKAATSAIKSEQEKAEATEAQLRSEVALGELRIVAITSGHIVRPFLFDRLKQYPPLAVGVSLAPNTGNSPEEFRFAQSLSSALVAVLGWKAPLALVSDRGKKVPPNSGVVIFNKWGSFSRVKAHPTGPPLLEGDPDFLYDGLKQKGASINDALRLSFIAMALDAKLEKDPSLDANTFEIVIGEPEQKP